MGMWRSLHPFHPSSPKPNRKDGSKRSARRSAKLRRSDALRSSRRALLMERFEDRLLLTAAPQLLSILANNGDIVFSSNVATQPLATAPNELDFLFNEGQTIDPATLGGIQIVRAGLDHTLNTKDDVAIQPGYVGIGSIPNEVVVRFASTLADDFYQITILGSGPDALTNTSSPAAPFNSGNPTQPNQQIEFQLDTAPQVLSVVPQPITRTAQGGLQQAADTINVYFNKPIHPLPLTVNQLEPHLFQLVATQNTADPSDDFVYNPATVSFDLSTNVAQLTFAGPLSSLGGGAFRLRIGNNQAVATGSNSIPAPIDVPLGAAGTTFGDPATLTQDPGPDNLGSLNTTPHQILSGAGTFIGPTPGGPVTAYPGGNIGPGVRDIPIEQHVNPAAQQQPGQAPYIPTITYNFPDVYGSTPGNPQLLNAITPEQKDLARQIFQLYSYYYGVQFKEVSGANLSDAQLGIVTGVVQAIAPSAPVSLPGIAQGPTQPFPAVPPAAPQEALAIMNAGLFNQESQYGGPWFQQALRQIGYLLGLGDDNEGPPGTVMGAGGNDPATGAPPENVFPGNADILHGRYLYRPNSNDVQMYKFTVTTPGTFSAETLAQRLTDSSGNPTSSSLNTVLTLYNETNVIQLPATGANPVGGAVVPGSTFMLNDGTNPPVTFEFDTAASPTTPGAISIHYLTSQTAHDVAVATARAINDYVANHALNVTAAVQFDRVVLSGPITLSHSATQGSVAYSVNREIISRNDDYFGTDSFVKLQLAPGYYYVAVTSVGNTNFNPSVANSGAGGTTSGAYNLLLDFTPEPVSTLTDDGLSLVAPNVPFGAPEGIQVNDKFTIGDGVNTARFQFVSGSAADVGFIPVDVALNAGQETVAQAILAALANVSNVNDLTPRYNGHGQVNLGGAASTSVTTTSSALTVWGTAQRHALQGNSDGATGAFNFWFDANDSSTIFVDRLSAAVQGPTLGSIDNPFNSIADALQTAANRIVAPSGPQLLLGPAHQTFIVNDGFNPPVNFEYSVDGGTVAPGNIPVSVNSSDTAAMVAQAIFNAIQGAAQSGFLALSPSFATPAAGSNVVDVAGASFVDVRGTPSMLAQSKTVRIVGNAGPDNSIGVPIVNTPSAATLAGNHASFSITAGTITAVFEFTQNPASIVNGKLANGNYAVLVASGDTAQTIANSMAAAINASALNQAAGGAVAASVAGDALAFRVVLTGLGQIAIDAQNAPPLNSDSNAAPYLLGLDQFTHQPLADGASLTVPQGVTVMIDAGAVFKMEGANVDVGLDSPNIDRSNAALQVLGTPTSSVFFTSFHDNRLGGHTDNVTPASPGDWGGIVFRNNSDREQQGIFLNHVNHANISYAGGTVAVDGVPAVYNPVFLDDARPTIAYNTISRSYDAAMSADPNSFQETIFGSPAYDPATGRGTPAYVADYNRTGPEIHGNALSVHTAGALAIVVPSPSQIIDGQTFNVETSDGAGGTSYTIFEFDFNNATTLGNFSVALKSTDTAAQVATKIAAAITAANISGVAAAANAVVSGGQTLQEVLVSGASSIKLSSSRVLAAPAGSSVFDGQTFVIVNPVTGASTTFEFDNAGGVTPGNIAVPFLTGDASAALAAKIAAAINGAAIGTGAIASGSTVRLIVASSFNLSTAAQGFVANLQTLTVPAGNALTVGSTFTATSASTGAKTIFEFTKDATKIVNGKLANGNVAILYTANDNVATIASSSAAAVNGQSLGVTAIATSTGFVLTGVSPLRFASQLRLVSPVAANTLNALFVRTQTIQGQQPEALNVSARFASTDIVYVISDNLVIQGNPGGLLNNAPRLSGRLAIDAGAIVKLLGARIEVQMGANLIAEGSAAQQTRFTSLKDDSYGAGGTFDTNGDRSNVSQASAPRAGDWAGLYFAPTSHGSLDHALLAYGGGSSTIEGGSDNFNVVEIRQADVRLADSEFQSNAAGLTTTSTRGGRLGNDSATIYVLGAQPALVNNVFINNLGSVISINANSLTSEYHPDPGRSTGPIQRFSEFDDNQGPLVRLNRIGNVIGAAAINGMLVRGATLDTSSVWDDTDIVHVVANQIRVPNVDSRGGLLLKSSSASSLVVKLEGDSAGLTATGRPLDIQDRIGGSVQIVGTPNHNVVLTSLSDASVGAGFTPDGSPQNDTKNTGVGGFSDNIPTFPPSGGQLTVTPTNNAGTLLNSMLLRPVPTGVTLGGATYVGGATEAGTYINGDGVPLQIPQKGAVLTTGNANIAAQNTSAGFGANLDLPGDPNLTGLIGGTATFDACELTFTVNVDPASNIKSGAFEFQFGSEEFPEFVGSFNDILAGWINGDPATNFIHDSQGNLVSINNALFDLDNNVQAPAASPLKIEYDGMTSGLVARFPLKPGVNTITIAVADAADHILDSGVLLTDLHFSTQDVGSGGVIRSGASAGQWQGITLDQNSNDRNVATINEAEPASTSGVEANGTIASSQYLGALAPNLNSGDDLQRLGFVVNGTVSLNSPGDADLYRFQAVPGTQVWIDIGATTPGLDSVAELVDAFGTVVARSDNSVLEASNASLLQQALPNNAAAPMQGDALLHGIYDPASQSFPGMRDLNSTNPHDAGFRVVLPGNGTAPANYYVRVRSKGADLHYNDLHGGKSSGAYQLQVRLREQVEYAGSTVQNADIRFATNGIEIVGLPAHSPLVAEAGSAANHGSLATAQELGNLLTTDRNTIGVSGNLAPNSQDWYRFELNYDLAQVIADVNNGDKTFSAIFDIDYADGISRPNTTISVFDASGNLLYLGRDSNIGNDQPLPNQPVASAFSDLTRGTAGQLDPFIGAVQLPTGPTRTYYVAISSDAQLPTALNAAFARNASQPLIRLEPINSVRRVVEDHVGAQGGQTAQNPASLTPAFSGDTASQAGIDQLNAAANAFKLSDVVLFVDQGGAGGHLQTVNPFTGQAQTDVGLTPSSGFGYDDIATRNDGRLYGFTLGPINVGGGNYNLIDTGNAQVANQGNNGIVTYQFNNANPPALAANSTGVQVHAIAFDQAGGPAARRLFGVGSYAGGPGVPGFVNGLYQFDPNTGAALGKTGNAANPTDPAPQILNLSSGPGGQITGMAYVNGVLYAVTSQGGLYTINNPGGAATATYVGTATALAGVAFTGLTAGPQRAEGGRFANFLFATDASGNLWCFDTAGALQNVFANNSSSIPLGVSNLVGLAFSTVDYNLWHVTNRRDADAGHGINVAPDSSRDVNSAGPAQPGNASFYFGLEAPSSLAPNSLNANSQPDAADFASNPALYGTYNLPGGAYGSLQTNPFTLADYSAGDKPTLYFNYFLNTEQAASTPANPTGMRDSARVFASADGGQTWQMLATNNPEVPTSKTDPNGELPSYQSVSSNTGSGDPRQQVQQLFDSTGTWRQARVDLGAYAGYSHVLLRFDFSTAGSMNQPGLPGDNFGNFSSNQRGQNNNHEGWYVDDITIGFAERGEMVTGATVDSTFFTVPQNPNAGAPTQILAGAYQLEIRRGESYGQTVEPLLPGISLTQAFDTNDRLASGFTIVAPSGGAVTDGQTFTVNDGVRTVVFEFDNNGALSQPGASSVPFQSSYNEAQMAGAIAAAINGATALKGISAGTVRNSVLTLTAHAGDALTDGQTFAVADRFGHSAVFEYDSNGTVAPGRVAVPFQASWTSAQTAASIATAVNGATQLQGLNVDAIAAGAGSIVVVSGVSLNTTTGDRVEVYGAASVSAVSAAAGTISISFSNAADVNHGSIAENGGTTTIWLTSSGPVGTQTLVTLKAVDVADAAGANPPLSGNVTLQYGSRTGSLITAVSVIAGQATPVLITGLAKTSNNVVLADGTQAVQLIATATAVDYKSNSATVDVTSDPSVLPALSVAIDAPKTLSQDAAAPIMATLTLNTGPLNRNVTVNLRSLNSGAASVPASVTIPAGQTSVSFPVSAVDNGVIGHPAGQQLAMILATSAGFLSGADTLIVLDDANGSITLNGGPGFVAEGPAHVISGQTENIPDPITGGINPVAGAIQTVLVDPSNPNVIYVGAVNGGIWKTTNGLAVGGPTWTPLTDEMPSLSIGDLQFDPTDPTHQTLIAGIGRFSNFASEGGLLRGLMRTADGGQTWTLIDPGLVTGPNPQPGFFDNRNISSVAARGQTIIAGASGSNGGLFVSTDGGNTFTQISGGLATGLPAGPVSDLASDPNDPNRLYVGVLGRGIFTSVNQGQTWSDITPASLVVSANTDASGLRIAVSRLAGSAVFFGYVSPSAGGGQLSNVFRSADHGVSWQALDLPQTNENGTLIGIHPGEQGFVNFAIIADPTNANLVYVGGDRQPGPGDFGAAFPNSLGAQDYSARLFRGDASQPSGSQWTSLTNSGTSNNSSPHADSRDMAFAGNLLIETDDGGVYQRTNPQSSTGSWLSLNGNLQITELHSIAYDLNTHTILGGSQDTGSPQQLVRNGLTWENVGSGDGGAVAVDNSNPNQSIRYTSSQLLGNFQAVTYDAAGNQVGNPVFPSLIVNGTGGQDIYQVDAGLPFVTPLKLNHINPNQMVIGGGSAIYESFDGGNTLRSLGAGGAFDGAIMDYGGRVVDQFGNAQNNPGILWAGVGGSVFLRTTANGPLTLTNYAGGNVTALVMNPNNWQQAFVTDDAGRVFMTTDRGVTFVNISGAVGGASSLGTLTSGLKSIAFVPGASAGTLFVGAVDGVYSTQIGAGGGSGVWARYGQGLPHVPIYALQYVPSEQILVVGSLGRGAFIVNALGASGDVTVAVNGAKQATDDAGVLSQKLTITRLGTSGNLTVNLSSSDPAVASVPATVVIPDGQSSVQVDVTVIDSVLARYPATAVFTASVGGLNGISDSLDVLPDGDGNTPTDNDLPALTVSIPDGVQIQAGSAPSSVTATVTRNTPTDEPLTVVLLSSDPSKASIPTTLVIPAGQASATFVISAVDLFGSDAARTITVTAAAAGYASGDDSVSVEPAAHILAYDRVGDPNLYRDQGQVVIQANTISNSLNFGIAVHSSPRDQATGQSVPGVVQNLSTLNAARLAPGATIENNLIVGGGQGGIQFLGDSNPAGVAPAAVPFGRIVNNTIYGQAAPAGVGVQVGQNASPTILNNIFANLATGISVDGTSTSTVAQRSVYQNNTTNLSGGVFGGSDVNSLALTPTDKLFANATNGDFYLLAGSLAIDSALNQLADRSAMHAAKTSTGIPDSPLAAPSYDLYGQLRTADQQTTPGGVGSTQYKDRGAIEHVDYAGPTSALANPLDNEAFDQFPALNVVHDVGSSLTDFAVQLLDKNGVGIDDSTVDGSKFVLYRNGALLQQGIDYFFRYDNNAKVVHFTPATGVWLNGNEYTIGVNNGVHFDPFNTSTPATSATGIKDLAGNLLLANSATGYTRYDIRLQNAGGDAPTIGVPGVQSVLEHGLNDAPPHVLEFSNATGNPITVFDITAPNNPVTITLNSVHGVLTLAGVAGLSGVTGNGTSSVTFTATSQDNLVPLTAINAALNGLTFSPALFFSGSTAIEISATDNVTLLTGLKSAFINVIQVNQAPLISLPASATTPENVPLLFSSAGGNPITISDPDAAATSEIRATLVATNGTVTLGTKVGLTLINGTGINDGSVTFQGTLSAINAALNGLLFRPALNFAGAASIEFNLNDLGNTGNGPQGQPGVFPQTSTTVLNINVTPVDQPPFVKQPNSLNNLVVNENSHPTVIDLTQVIGDPDTNNPSPEPLPTVTVSGNTNSALVQVSINPTTHLMTLTYGANQFGQAFITLSAADAGASHATLTYTFRVTVNKVELAPVATSDSYLYDVNTPLVVTSPGVLGNDVELNREPIKAVLFDVPAHGKLTLNPDGSFTYLPDPGFDGRDHFVYKVENQAGMRTAASVTLDSPTSRWVARMYTEVLGRTSTPGDAEVNYWVSQLDHGQTRKQVSDYFVTSPERRSQLISQLYVTYLGRAVDQGGLNYWLSVWAANQGPEQVQAGIIGSLEYFTTAAAGLPGLPPAAAWVTRLYENLLHRDPGPDEVAYWTGYIQTHSRQSVVLGFVTSDEYRLGLMQGIPDFPGQPSLNGWYQQFLHRSIDNAGAQYWLQQMRNGYPQEAILEGILASAEYFFRP